MEVRPADDRDGPPPARSGLSFGGILPTEEERRADPRKAILAAAAELFAARGPAQVSLRAIAAEAGVPYSLIYRFYRTKEELVARVMELFVVAGRRAVADEADIYDAIGNAFVVDSGWFGQMIVWAIADKTAPDRLMRGDSRSGAYRAQIEEMWADPHPPRVRGDFDPRVLASIVQLMALSWDMIEPYLTALAGPGMPAAADQRAEVIELLKLLVYAARPVEEPGSPGGEQEAPADR